ncbi:MAG: MarR family transcriptional regulator [Candidatus Gastranaerophilales bacterium]|nr:MarR family transcriptional regulator [Candidatus Gastranaerophilales bacterium]
MQDNIYLEKQSTDAKLIYTAGFLWNNINDKIDKTLKPYNLNSAKFNILMIIKHVGKDEGVQQNFISDKLLVTPSNITKMLDKLEAEELITRNDKKNDRRVKIIKITQKGIELLDKVWNEYKQTISNLSPKISEKDKESLLAALIKWQDNI